MTKVLLKLCEMTKMPPKFMLSECPSLSIVKPLFEAFQSNRRIRASVTMRSTSSDTKKRNRLATAFIVSTELEYCS